PMGGQLPFDQGGGLPQQLAGGLVVLHGKIGRVRHMGPRYHHQVAVVVRIAVHDSEGAGGGAEDLVLFVMLGPFCGIGAEDALRGGLIPRKDVGHPPRGPEPVHEGGLYSSSSSSASLRLRLLAPPSAASCLPNLSPSLAPDSPAL